MPLIPHVFTYNGALKEKFFLNGIKKVIALAGIRICSYEKVWNKKGQSYQYLQLRCFRTPF